MILISIRGLDQFVVGHYSKKHGEQLAQLFEVAPEEIDFYAPYGTIFHEGVEQTSWNTYVCVECPGAYASIEDKIAKYLISTLSEFSIHLKIYFRYSEDRVYEHKNPDYPLHITESNIVAEEEYDEEYEGEGDPRSRPDLDYNDPSQIYLGNTFENLDEKIEEELKRREAKEQDEHECADGHCCCHHHE